MIPPKWFYQWVVKWKGHLIVVSDTVHRHPILRLLAVNISKTCDLVFTCGSILISIRNEIIYVKFEKNYEFKKKNSGFSSFIDIFEHLLCN